MIAGRIPLLALAAFPLGALPFLPAQQPAAPTHGNTATTQQGKSQADSAPAPQGNLIIQVMDSNGTPFPGAQLEVDGMRTGRGQISVAEGGGAQAAPASAAKPPADSAQASRPHTACPTSPYAPPSSPPAARDRTGSAPAGSTQPGNAPQNGSQTQPSGGGSSGGLLTRHSGSSHPASAPPDGSQSQPAGNQPETGQSGNGQPGSAPPASADGKSQPQPGGNQLCTVPGGTAQSIGTLMGNASPEPGGPSLPPGAIPLTTDAQGQLILQLPSGEHSISVSVYGFEPFTGHFTLSGKHRQLVQVKLSASPPTYVFVVGPDSRVQLETPEVDALIPLEPLQTLGPLAPRTRRRLI
jgi:hypothetical protein